jgi:hypothetical protein
MIEDYIKDSVLETIRSTTSNRLDSIIMDKAYDIMDIVRENVWDHLDGSIWSNVDMNVRNQICHVARYQLFTHSQLEAAYTVLEQI